MSETMSCPKCGGNTWDNRATKRNPKMPDYKCRDKNCDGVIWPPRDGAQKPTPAAKAPYVPRDMGPNVPGLESDEDEVVQGPYKRVLHEHAPPANEKSTAIYLKAMSFVVNTVVPVWEAGKIPFTASDINAATATIMIDHQRRSGR